VPSCAGENTLSTIRLFMGVRAKLVYGQKTILIPAV
jgi:hypothetical protein